MSHRDLVAADTPRTRRDRIIILLDHYPDYFTTLGRSDTTGTGGIAGLPAMSDHPSVRELLRSLQQLQERCTRDYQHTKAFYTAERRQVPAKARVRGPHGKPITVDGYRIERIVPRWVDLDRVRAGVDFIDHVFQGEPFIPDELLESAIAS